MTTPEHDDHASMAPMAAASEPTTTPFQVIGSDDAGYCTDGVCIIPGAESSASA